MPSSSPAQSVTSKSSRAEVVVRYQRMTNKQVSPAATSTRMEAISTEGDYGDDENVPTPVSRTATPRSRYTSASPLSPKNGDSVFKSREMKPTPPLPERNRQDFLSSEEPSLLVAPSPTPLSASARRERLARHARLLGNRGRSTAPTSQNTPVTDAEREARVSTKTPACQTKYESPSACKTPTVSLSEYYDFEKPSTKKTTLPPKTPSSHQSSSKSVCSVDEVTRRVRERRARGAKKLFILATSPSTEDDNVTGDLTPLERHLSSHKTNDDADDSPSVISDISTITMSTLSSQARDKRKFSRERKFSASKLYARATGSSSTSTAKEKTTKMHSPPVGRGRSPVRSKSVEMRITERKSPPKERGTPVRDNSFSTQRVHPASSQLTSSGSGAVTSVIGRRATSLQKARRLARSRSVDRRPVDRQQHASPKPSPSGHSVISTPVSNNSKSVISVGSSRAGSRASSIQKARRTLARTKSQGTLKPTPPSSQKSAPPPVFIAREKVEAQARLLSLAPQTRRNLDKRTARLKYHKEFSSEIAKCREETGKSPPKHINGVNLHRRGEHGVSIFIRKRPIFAHEVDSGDFDVVFTEGRSDCDAAVIYSCNMHAHMRKMLVKPIAFPCSAAFDETCTNDMLYTHVGKPLVRLAATGGLATLLTYGQTGSGKTHTITGMEERVCKDLFRMTTKLMQVTVQFIELAGKQCRDLLGNGNVQIVDQEDGSVLLLNSVSEKVYSPEELYNTILRGKLKRATESTEKNDASSRSHAVCKISIKKNVRAFGDSCNVL